MSTNIKLKANGKLLISGEYFVLDGAKALAFPICYGQEMNITQIPQPTLNWKSTENDQVWFTASFKLPDLSVIKTSDTVIALELRNILSSALSLNPEFMLAQCGFSIEVNANYPLKWGFGSSSTLISMIARWANVDEYILYRMLSDGSGYDIACATQRTPIFYQLTDELPVITQTDFGNGLKNYCLFAYLGNKQNSKKEIKRYKKSEVHSQKLIDRVSELADEFCRASNANEFIDIINEHEQILSSVLKKPVLAQHERFHNFAGAVKSMGAWGGDFAMFTADKSLSDLREDLKQFGITTIFSYDELLIKD